MLGHIVRRSPSPATVISLFALFVALGGTAYAATGGTFILGQANTAGAASSLTSTVTSAPALTVKNTGGKPAAKFTSNTGVAPFQVSNGTKVKNLNADMLDGVSASAFALGQNVTVLANRIVMGNGDPDATLLTLPGLGVLTAFCLADNVYAGIYYDNSTADSIDLWNDISGSMNAYIATPTSLRTVTYGNGATQDGTTLNLGQGNSPGARRTASVTVSAYRSAAGAPCALQATATLWTTP